MKSNGEEVMSRVLVSILSKQTIPNYLFIKEMEGQYDQLLFISTIQANRERIGEAIEKALGQGEWTVPPIPRIVVDANNYCEALHQLKEQGLSEEDHYLVNITGGTKAMSLAVVDYFSLLPHNTIYYLPINNRYHNITDDRIADISYSLSLKEYFWLYGIDIKVSNAGHRQPGLARQIYNELKQINFRQRTKRLLNPHNRYSEPEDKAYFDGGWFEEYVYHQCKRALGLREDQVASGIALYRDGEEFNDNEVDVAYVSENRLYIIECKVWLSAGTENNKKLNSNVHDALYKLAAISKDFGLVVHSYLFAIYPPSQLSEKNWMFIKRRCKLLGVSGVMTNQEVEKFQG